MAKLVQFPPLPRRFRSRPLWKGLILWWRYIFYIKDDHLIFPSDFQYPNSSQSKEAPCWLSKFCLFWYWKMGETVEKIPCIVNWRDDDHGKLCDDDDGMFILIIYLELLLEWCDCYCVACHHCHIMSNISIKYSFHLRKWSEVKESYFWGEKNEHFDVLVSPNLALAWLYRGGANTCDLKYMSQPS